MVGPDAHFAVLVPDLVSSCAQLEPEAEELPVQAHISPDTMELIRRRAQLRCYLRCENRELRRRRLLICFAAFVAGTSNQSLVSTAPLVARRWIFQMDISIATAVSMLNHLAGDLRRAVKWTVLRIYTP